jgi:hypothetical protein
MLPLYHAFEGGAVALLITASAAWLIRLAWDHPGVRSARGERTSACGGCATRGGCSAEHETGARRLTQ